MEDMRMGRAITIAIARKDGWRQAMRVVETNERIGESMEETLDLFYGQYDADAIYIDARHLRDEYHRSADMICLVTAMREDGDKVIIV